MFKLIWRYITILLNFSPEKKDSWDRFFARIRDQAGKNRLTGGLYLLLERFYHRKYLNDDQVLRLFNPREQLLNHLLFFAGLALVWLIPFLHLFPPAVSGSETPALNFISSLLLPVGLALGLGLAVSALNHVSNLLAGPVYTLLPLLLIAFFQPLFASLANIDLLILFLFIILSCKSSDHQSRRPGRTVLGPDFPGFLLFAVFLSRPLYRFFFNEYQSWLHLLLIAGLAVIHLGLQHLATRGIPALPWFSLLFFLVFFSPGLVDPQAVPAQRLFFDNLFHLLAPLWFFIGNGIFFKILKNVKAITQSFHLMFSDRFLKFLFYFCLSSMAAAGQLSVLAPETIPLQPGSALWLALPLLGWIAVLLLLYPVFSRLFKEYRSGLEFNLLFVFLLAFFLVYEYFFQMTAAGTGIERLRNPLLYSMLLTAFMFLFLKIGVFSLQKRLAEPVKHYFRLLLAAIFLFALAFHFYFAAGAQEMFNLFFHHLWLGLVYFGIPYAFYVFYARECGENGRQYFLYFMMGFSFTLVAESARKIIWFGGMDQALQWCRDTAGAAHEILESRLDYADFSSLLIFFAISGMLQIVVVFLSIRSRNRENALLFIFFLVSGTASAAFYFQKFDLLDWIHPGLQYLIFPSRPFLFFSGHYFLGYLVFMPAALPLCLLAGAKKHRGFFWPAALLTYGLVLPGTAYFLENSRPLLAVSGAEWPLLACCLAAAGWPLTRRAGRKTASLLAAGIMILSIPVIVFRLAPELFCDQDYQGINYRLPRAYRQLPNGEATITLARLRSGLPMLSLELFNPLWHPTQRIHELLLRKGFSPIRRDQSGEFQLLFYSDSAGEHRALAFSSEPEKSMLFSWRGRPDWLEYEINRVLKKNSIAQKED